MEEEVSWLTLEPSSEEEEEGLIIHEPLQPFPLPSRCFDFVIPALDDYLGREDDEYIVIQC
jgi:hypothetical protein